MRYQFPPYLRMQGHGFNDLNEKQATNEGASNHGCNNRYHLKYQ